MSNRQQLLYEIAAALDEGQATLPENLVSEIRTWTDQVRVLDGGGVDGRIDDGRIVLRLKYAPRTDPEKDEPPEGVQVEWKTEPSEYEPYEDITWAEWTLPTLGKTLYMRGNRISPPTARANLFRAGSKRAREADDRDKENLVLSFGGRSWVVYLYNFYTIKEKERDGLPLQGDPLVVFKPTDDPVTTESDYNDPEPGYRGTGVQVFGQPNFAQWEHYPSLNGKSAYLLWSRENGLGDLGLENVFIALDDQGVPCQAWIEEDSH